MADEGMELARITIIKTLFEDDILVNVEAITPDGDSIPLVDALGMIELGKDSLIRESMGDG